jgi:hypothetical protein
MLTKQNNTSIFILSKIRSSDSVISDQL